MNRERLENTKIRVDIIYKKLILFIAIAGGSWVYGTKYIETSYGIFLLLFFAFISFGIILNILKLNEIEKLLKKEYDGNTNS